MNVGKNYEDRWRHNVELSYFELELFFAEESVPFDKETVINVCIDTGIAYRGNLLPANPTIHDFIGTIKESEWRHVFRAHYIAEDKIIALMREERKTDRVTAEA